MKTWALVFILVAAVVVPVHKAEAKKNPKPKVVVVSFSEDDLKQKQRGPASVESQKVMEAEARHIARLGEANFSIPEM